MEVKYDIVICTTAVSRSQLHTHTFPKYVEFLEGLKCLWIVNIDQIEGESVDVTYSILKELSNSPDITLHVRLNTDGGTRANFYNSAQYLASIAKDVIPEYGYLWLEDDWEWYGTVKLKELLTSTSFKSYDYLQLVQRNTELSFNPSVYGVELFRDIIVKGLEKPYSIENANPERACTYPPSETLNLVSRYYATPSFRDIGREWTRSKGIWRTFQKTE